MKVQAWSEVMALDEALTLSSMGRRLKMLTVVVVVVVV